MSEPVNEDGRVRVQFHVPEDIDYVYRDIFNVFVGTGEVVVEFGTMQRGRPGHASIGNRIVLSFGNAHLLMMSLQSALQEAQIRIQQAMENNNRAAALRPAENDKE